jgi:hypothetical protein
VNHPQACLASRLGRFGITLLAWGAAGFLSAAQPPVPPKYTELYRGLERLLDAELARPAPADTGPLPLAGADLLMANSNRGEALLDPATLAAVGPCLDRFRELGLGWVRFELQYPLLRVDFPRHAEYLVFYRQVVQLAHARGLKVMPHVTVLFSDTPFSPFKDLYRGLDLERFKREYRSMVRIVLRQLQPDYLALLTEPDTQARLTGLRELADPKVAADVVNFVLEGTDRGRTLIGAGSGSWSGPAYAREFAQHTSVDFVSIHVYPVTGDMVGQARELARIARAAGKQAFMDESWLMKTLQPGRGGLAATAGVFRLDPYSFWAPLDQKFIALMLKLAREERIGLVSFFWSSELFAYLDYSPSLDWRRYAKIRQLHGQAAYRAILDGKFTPTGDYLRTVLK